MKRMSVLMILLLGCLVLSASLYAGSYAGVNIVVTDLSGKEYKVADADEPFSIDLTVSSNGPRKWYRVYAGNITEATFTRVKNATTVSVVLKDGSRMTGLSTQQDQIIRGVGPLGSEFSIAMNKVKKIVFESTRLPDEFMSQRFQYSNWMITDGDSEISVKTLILIDSFLDNRDFIRGGTKNQFDKRSVWRGLTSEDLLLTQGEALLRLPFKDISLIEITGKLINGKPEVKILKKDGASAVAGLYFCAKYTGNQASFNGFEDEDYYAWEDKPFGIRAISLKPLRKITFRKLQ